MSYTVANVYPHDGERFSTLNEARKAMQEWGYVALECKSCDGSAEYWADINDLPGDAVSVDDLDAPDAWADEYIGDGAYTPQILSKDEK